MTTRAKRPAAVTWIAAGVAALAAALYLPTLANGFVNWDDPEYLLHNPYLLAGFDGTYVAWAFTTFHKLNYQPLTWLSLGIDYAIHGLTPGGFHLTSLLLYAGTCFAIVVLAWRLLEIARPTAAGNVAAAAVAGALFAVHPLHVESIAWVAERKDQLYALFYVLALLAWLAYAQAPDSRRLRLAYVTCLACFVLSALSKAMAVTLPVVLLLLDAYPLGRLRADAQSVRIAIVEKLPFFAISAASSVLTVLAQGAGGALGALDQSLWERILVAERAIGFYLAKLIAPVGLHPYYPPHQDVSPLAAPYVAAFALIVVISALAVWSWRTRPYIAAAWAFMLVTLSPVLGIVQVGGQAAADRYMYLPMLGPLLLLGAGAGRAWEAGAAVRWIAVGATGVVVVLLGARSIDQMSVWSDSETLWTHVLSDHPEAVTAHYNLGQEYLARGDSVRAERSFRRALEFDPDFVPALTEMGAMMGRLGSFREAEKFLRRAVEADPRAPIARYNLALTLENMGNFEAARPHYQAFVETAPPIMADAIRQVRAKLGAP